MSGDAWTVLRDALAGAPDGPDAGTMASMLLDALADAGLLHGSNRVVGPRIAIERDGVRIEAGSLDDLTADQSSTRDDWWERFCSAVEICAVCGANLSPADGGELGRHDDGCIVAALDPERRRSDARMIDEARAAARGVEERQRRIDAARAAAGVAPGEALLGLRLPEPPPMPYPDKRTRPALAALIHITEPAGTVSEVEAARALLDALAESLDHITLPDPLRGTAAASLPFLQLISACRITLAYAGTLPPPTPEETP